MKNILLAVNILLLVITNLNAEPLKKISFRPQWAPQSQFAGYYVALEKKFYEEAGLQVEIRPGGPGIIALNQVAAGEVTFGTTWLMSGMSLASKGAPIVNIAQIFQTTGLMLIAHKDSGLTSPKQMAGKRVGIWPGLFDLPARILFQKENITPKYAAQKFTMDEFIEKKLDVASAMSYNEYHTVLESGIPAESINTFLFTDYDLNFPGDGIYAHQKTVTLNPELCRGFVQASIKGWLYAFKNQEEAVSIIMKAANKAKIDTTVQHQSTMLKEIEKLVTYRVGIDGNIGELDKNTFKFVHQKMTEAKQIKKPLSYEIFYQAMH